jgi:hypothetical protein
MNLLRDENHHNEYSRVANLIWDKVILIGNERKKQAEEESEVETKEEPATLTIDDKKYNVSITNHEDLVKEWYLDTSRSWPLWAGTLVAAGHKPDRPK